jgi:hypothetical protein
MGEGFSHLSALNLFAIIPPPFTANRDPDGRAKRFWAERFGLRDRLYPFFSLTLVATPFRTPPQDPDAL